jgi:hypothetical protein
MLVYTLDRRPIRLTCEYPPIPQRHHDWSAIFDDLYDGAPDAGPQLQGWGPTPQAALIDLFEQELEHEPNP